MRVHNDQILQCVLFIGAMDDRGNFLPLGTGFIVVVVERGFPFQMVVTARHVIERMAGKKIFLRATVRGGGVEVFQSLKSEWIFHPAPTKDHYIDVAVLPSHIPVEKLEIQQLRIDWMMLKDEIIHRQNFGIGDDVYVCGLFTNHYGIAKNIPVVRCGTIATMPQEPMLTEFGYVEGYLIETLSLGGLSGSPVFLQASMWRYAPAGMTGSTVQPKLREGDVEHFLGLICGHWVVQNPEDAVINADGTRGTGNINTGMGIVIPAKHIMETINHPGLVAQRTQIAERNKQKRD